MGCFLAGERRRADFEGAAGDAGGSVACGEGCFVRFVRSVGALGEGVGLGERPFLFEVMVEATTWSVSVKFLSFRAVLFPSVAVLAEVLRVFFGGDAALVLLAASTLRIPRVFRADMVVDDCCGGRQASNKFRSG